MKDRSRNLIKNTGILTISNFSSKILVFLLVPLYTNILSTTDYGNYDLVANTVQLLMPILTINVYEGVMRYVMDESKPKDQVVTIGFKYVFIGSALFSLAVLINRYFCFWEMASEYSIYIIMYFTFGLLNQFAIQLAKGFEQVKSMAIAGVIGTLLVVGSNVIFLLGLNLGLKGFFLAYIIGYIIPASYIFIKLRIHRYFIRSIDTAIQNEMLSYSAPLILNTLGWWANSASDRYVVTWICGVAINGIYSVSYKIPSILNVIQGIFIQAWQISAIKEHDSEDVAIFYGKALYTINILMSVTCMVLIAATIPIAKILYAKDFFVAWYYVPFLLLSSVINAASGVLGPILSARKDSKSMGIAALYGAVSNIILNIILVNFIGAQGAAIATAISSFIIYESRLRAVGDEIYHPSYYKILVSWIILSIQSLLLIYTRLHFLQIFIIVLFAIIYFKDLKDIMIMGKRLIKR